MLSAAFNAEEAALRICRRMRDEEIADVLLHQEVLAGVGNVFKSEICFVTGIQSVLQGVATLSARAGAGAVAARAKTRRAPTCSRIPATRS